MSGKFLSVLALMLCLSFTIVKVDGHNSGYEIVAVYGSTPTIDGAINTTEWSDAASVSFNKTEVLVKQDGVSLYVGFNMPYTPADLKYDAVYVFLDLDDNGGLTPQSDDIGLVVYNNGTLAEGNVTAGIFAFTEVNGWSAETQSYPSMWQVEFNITYSKVKAVAGLEKSIGAFFMSTYGGTTHYYWPPTMDYGNYGVPSEWGAITSTGYDWIPELRSILVIPLFMIATLLAVIVYRRKHAFTMNRGYFHMELLDLRRHS